jgi:AhpD family alkylhydroperoxidase
MAKRLDYHTLAAPGIKALGAVSAYGDDCSIEPKLRRLVELRVSQINGCAYCLDLHARQLRELGEKQQRLDVLSAWHETSLFTERESVALAWAESVTLVSSTHVPDYTFAAARAQLSERELADLTLIIATMNAWNRMAISFRSEPPEPAPGLKSTH